MSPVTLPKYLIDVSNVPLSFISNSRRSSHAPPLPPLLIILELGTTEHCSSLEYFRSSGKYSQFFQPRAYPILNKIEILIEDRNSRMTVVSQNAQPVYRTATIRKLKRTHEDSLASSVSTNDSLRISSSTIGSQFQPSRPILRSASVIKTKNIKNDLCHYGAYTDDQPENLIFRRGKFFNFWKVLVFISRG